MFKASKALGFAALMMLVAAGLHIATPAIAGFNEETFWLVPMALLYAIIVYRMIPNRRFTAWIGFFVLLAGTIAAVGLSAAGGVIPPWWWLLILGANLLAALCLFLYLWNDKPVPA